MDSHQYSWCKVDILMVLAHPLTLDNRNNYDFEGIDMYLIQEDPEIIPLTHYAPSGLTLAIRQFAIGESRRCLAKKNQDLSPVWRIQITDALKI